VSISAPLAAAVVLRNVLRVIIEVASLRKVGNKQAAILIAGWNVGHCEAFFAEAISLFS
jgi:hypothetical protein